ncbi:Type IV pili methyl-accepting chemotaxis transducer N-term [Pseudosulfitobacter pseudonitzschiae]|uniref:NarX-like N-terminal domain-containing protein n=1 Tax=Pseudosulfitobacter pseudonitzschiae TaxID=1402135 RepID=A0A073IYP3_9RHOB|nr:type IV pili methyl-accepting chemotaxis transducer N-terminal domain-containing protein [Pseudosulfitobacter pseudonitzschiae]KEJ94541.1 hypothetical protein SUH3_05805 [Pseudosulfitobacter pseudonitzschiae]QKS08465.1 type IV pili methyl-accepting chemotaxis transducer N-terminal domain-containing protein [Pseudosulfitobacter pseudonitzschiae]SHF75087.1 Type IV pili methyl-accepting chemotaxis transducer N-term [Pseudosulfitobacter pseudonitzschiae]
MRILSKFAFLWCVIPMCGLVPEATAQVAASGSAVVVRVDISGRQRMLSQRMAMASCFVMGDVETEKNIKNAHQAYDLFSQTQGVLRHGGTRDNLEPERDPQVLALLDQSDEIFDTYGRAVLQVTHQDLQSVVVAQVTELDLPLLKLLNQTVGAIEASGTSATQDGVLANTVNIAGRQRMLSQKVLKEFCYVSLGVDRERQQKRLAETLALFETSLALLETGSAEQNVLAPPNKRARGRLKRARLVWEKLSPILHRAIAGQDLSRDDLHRVASFSEDLLKASQHVVASYLKL